MASVEISYGVLYVTMKPIPSAVEILYVIHDTNGEQQTGMCPWKVQSELIRQYPEIVKPIHNTLNYFL